MPAGLRLALTTFTVLPLRGGRVDRAAAGTAMALAPLVGAGLGAVLAGLGLGLTALGTPVLVVAVLVVLAEWLLTRGLHVDGLADTVDGLGSYRDRDRALAIMRSPEIGPFAVAAIGVDLLLRVACLAALLAGVAGDDPFDRPTFDGIVVVTGAPGADSSATGWTVLVALVCVAATGRLAVTFACRPGVPSARPGGLGALVAGAAPLWTALAGLVAVAALAVLAVPDRPWQGPLAVLVALGLAELLRWHAARRLGGITGDVLGALVEVATLGALMVQVMGT